MTLSPDTVKPEVSGFGVRPLSVTELREHFWQVNFKLPPLPAPGWHEVRVRLEDGPRSNPQMIALDLPFLVDRVCLRSACDGASWQPDELDTAKGQAISFWMEGLPENADLNNIKATLGGQRLRLLYLEPPPTPAAGGFWSRFRRKPPARQVNACLTGDPPVGRVPLEVQVGGVSAGRILIRLK